jgi:hypothetical protein
LIPSFFVDVRAKRAAIPGVPGFVTDHLGFVLFIISAFVSAKSVQPILEGFIHDFIMTTHGDVALAIANLVLILAEFIAFKVVILGRS